MARIAGVISPQAAPFAAYSDAINLFHKRLRGDLSSVEMLMYSDHFKAQRTPQAYSSSFNSLLWLAQHHSLPLNTGAWAIDSTKQFACLLDGAVYEAHQSGNDAAYLLNRFLDEGLSAFNRVNGKFACCIIDYPNDQVWLIRDRLGVKPLYFRQVDSKLYFASEQKALLLPNLGKTLHLESVFDFFVKGQVEIQADTLFEGIKQVLPGSGVCWHIKKNRLERVFYFDPKLQDPRGRYSPSQFERHSKDVKVLLDESVQKRLEKHNIQEPAALLSGGLDSSVLTSILAQTKSPKVLTAVIDQPNLSEKNWAQIMAEAVNAHWIKVEPTFEDFAGDLEDFIYSQDTPTLSSGTYLQYRLFKAAASENISMLFDGQAADGLFAGHQFHLAAYWKDLRRNGQWNQCTKEWDLFGGSTVALKYEASNVLKYNILPNLPLPIKAAFYRRYYSELQYLNRDFWEAYRHRLEGNGKAGMKSLNQMLYQGFYKGTIAFLLKCVDRASNYFGIESAMPFADSNLYEYVHQVPGIYKIHAGHQKWLLKEAYRSQLPKEIYHRTNKMALLSPNNQWLRALRPQLMDYFESLDGQVFNKPKILAELNDFFNPRDDLENYRIYKFASFAIWRNVFGI